MRWTPESRFLFMQAGFRRIDAIEIEGIVVKSLSGTYEPGKSSWVKWKPSYGEDAPSFDCLVVGGYYSPSLGAQGGLTRFLVALRAPDSSDEEPRFQTFARVRGRSVRCLSPFTPRRLDHCACQLVVGADRRKGKGGARRAALCALRATHAYVYHDQQCARGAAHPFEAAGSERSIFSQHDRSGTRTWGIGSRIHYSATPAMR